LGADRVELYTEPFARAFATSSQLQSVAMYASAATAAQAAGLGVNAGHDLNRINLPALLKAMPGLQEVSIGHALISDALEFGMAQTVRLYLEAIKTGGIA
jgi:pyridoxine 5-phosphate synthase